MILIPKGKLASSNDDALKKKREELRKKLLEGKKITINKEGNVSGDSSGSGISVPKGKLASFYWYERDPKLLVAEKYAMNKFFPNFQLSKEEDGRYSWIGTINTGNMPLDSEWSQLLGDNNNWTLQIVYDHSFPISRMGGSVKIYTINPDIDVLSKELGWTPHHLLRDEGGSNYLCTAESANVKAGNTVTSAATTLSWAVKWIMVYEMVLMGDVSTSQFDARTF
jgi:hypothetical protein